MSGSVLLLKNVVRGTCRRCGHDRLHKFDRLLSCEKCGEVIVGRDVPRRHWKARSRKKRRSKL